MSLTGSYYDIRLDRRVTEPAASVRVRHGVHVPDDDSDRLSGAWPAMPRSDASDCMRPSGRRLPRTSHRLSAAELSGPWYQSRSQCDSQARSTVTTGVPVTLKLYTVTRSTLAAGALTRRPADSRGAEISVGPVARRPGPVWMSGRERIQHHHRMRALTHPSEELRPAWPGKGEKTPNGESGNCLSDLTKCQELRMLEWKLTQRLQCGSCVMRTRRKETQKTDVIRALSSISFLDRTKDQQDLQM